MMLKYFFVFLIFVHGLIHFMGFAKAFNYGNITQLTKAISKPAGFFWLITAFLFIVAAILLLIKKEAWPNIAVVAAIISQILIITVWKDAKFGTIANIIVLLVAIAGWGNNRFESTFIRDVKVHLRQAKAIPTELLTDADIQSLPQPVQKYLRYCGVVNKPKVKNVRIEFEGRMRSKKKDWFPFTTVQYNFFDEPARLFFMKAKMFGITVPGYHDYQQAAAGMNIKLFGLFPVVQVSGAAMNRAETVTLFNDMCLMVPASLIDKRIEWIPVDSLSAKAIFTNGANKITATLYFNQLGQLVNFISDDRTDVNEMKQYRFSTPVKEYRRMGEINIMKYGEAVWHYPDGEFVYGEFNLTSIEYNVSDFKR
jgi:hypothetical protein